MNIYIFYEDGGLYALLRFDKSKKELAIIKIGDRGILDKFEHRFTKAMDNGLRCPPPPEITVEGLPDDMIIRNPSTPALAELFIEQYVHLRNNEGLDITYDWEYNLIKDSRYKHLIK